VTVNPMRSGSDAAIAACRAAVSAFPDEARFKYQLGRALGAAGKHAEASEWYERIADESYPAALADLGELYIAGKGVARDHARGFAMEEAAAEAGSVEGMYWLGVLHREGWGVAQDFAAARRFDHPGCAPSKTKTGSRSSPS